MWHRKGEVFPCRHYPPYYRNDPALSEELQIKYRMTVRPVRGEWVAETQPSGKGVWITYGETIRDARFLCACAAENIEANND